MNYAVEGISENQAHKSFSKLKELIIKSKLTKTYKLTNKLTE